MSEKHPYIILEEPIKNQALVLGFARSVEEAREFCQQHGKGYIYKNTLPRITQQELVEQV